MLERQRELVERFIVIERRNGFRWDQGHPVNLDSKYGQAVVKDYFWRITEELMEAVDALKGTQDTDTEGDFREELADATHFVLEAILLVGLTPEDLCPDIPEGWDALRVLLVPTSDYIDPGDHGLVLRSVAEVIYRLGAAGNTLSNRAWKQSSPALELPRFRTQFIDAVYSFFRLLAKLGLTADDVFNLYFGKAAINQQRQSSGY